MRFVLLFWVVIWAARPAFPQTIPSTVYSSGQLSVVNHTGYEVRTLVEGTTRDFSHLIIQAITLPANQPEQPIQQLDEEGILIIKAGELTLTLGNKHKTLEPGSIAMIMPGDDYRVENKAAQSLTYYLMRYTSNEMPDLDLYRLVGSSFWVDRTEITSATEHKEGDHRLVTYSSVMSNRIAMQVTTLSPDLGSHPPHTHRAAEILLILNHPVQATINGTLTQAQAGDLIFVESDVSHSFQTISQEGSTYVSIQF